MFIVDTDLCFNLTSTLIDENSDFFFVEYFRKRKKQHFDETEAICQDIDLFHVKRNFQELIM